MFSITKKSIDGGSAAYWADRKEAFRLIREADYCERRLKTAPLYFHRGYDADGDEIYVENLAPSDDFDDAIKALEANETAVGILAAQKRIYIGNQALHSVIRHLNNDYDY